MNLAVLMSTYIRLFRLRYQKKGSTIFDALNPSLPYYSCPSSHWVLYSRVELSSLLISEEFFRLERLHFFFKKIQNINGDSMWE